ncbi:helix-turn-helix transcriptional regulator [Streptomyces sp. CBMA29]|uniref:helix-turn-helix transcriptional regulator n=1 Tax=Streptomyces sp. CBMA29 TaxID=1896314 RepID=UPI00166204B0|nr:LuxR family transcriptional regulator [Streptomyces sp. CBMA29]MBD0738632.1 TrmB family transcriptional regulator [Streptomyces sp. CBMA29]
MALEAAGITDAEEAAYRLLVTMDSASAREIAEHSGLSPDTALSALTGLVAKAMASASDGRPPRYRAYPPDVALLPQLKHRADALDLAHSAAADLLESYRATARRRDAGLLIEVITGAEALRQRLRQIQADARDEMLWFCKAQYVAMPSGSNTAEFDALERGVRYRVLYERDFFDDEGAVGNIAAAVRKGEIARAVPHLPLRLAVADRSVAIFPLVPGGPHGSPEEPSTALVRDSSLLDALIALFERYWEDAIPLHVDASGAVTGAADVGPADPLTSTDRRLLSLMVAGVADKAIATQMNLSRRTLQRRVQSMMELAGATTRTQLAWQAARRGWL